MSHITITPIPLFEDNYVYLLILNKEALLIDAGDGHYLSHYLSKSHLSLNTILLTHLHHDHMGGVRELQSHFPDVTVLSSQHLHHKKRLFLFHNEVEIIPLFTEGHTDRDCSFYLPKQKVLFTGDTLFTGGCGRVKPNGDYHKHYRAMQLLRELPDDIKVYGGHEYLADNIAFINHLRRDTSFYQTLLETEQYPSLATTIGDEKHYNPFMADISEEEFIRLRKLKNNF